MEKTEQTQVLPSLLRRPWARIIPHSHQKHAKSSNVCARRPRPGGMPKFAHKTSSRLLHKIIPCAAKTRTPHLGIRMRLTPVIKGSRENKNSAKYLHLHPRRISFQQSKASKLRLIQDVLPKPPKNGVRGSSRLPEPNARKQTSEVRVRLRQYLRSTPSHHGPD